MKPSTRQADDAHAPLLESLPYHPDSEPLMRALRDLPGAAFLDSGTGTGENARYDILTALPALTLRLDDDGVSWHGPAADDLERPLTGDCIFTALEQALEALAPERELLEHSHPELPFRGGAIGYFGYESNAAMHGLERRRDEHPRAPPAAVPHAWLGIYQWAIVVDHHRRQSWLFMLPACPPASRRRIRRILQARPARPEPLTLRGTFRANMDRDAYRQRLQRLSELIHAGDCYQVNFAQCFQAPCQGDPFEAYGRLRRLSHSPFCAFLDCGDSHVLSFSPERFLEADQRRARTQPIKGTRPRRQDPALDAEQARELQASSKDRAENLMIVDLLRNDLGSVCEIGSVRTEALFELHSFSHVHHLISTITGRLPADTGPLALLRSCFPGGSITGAPKRRAMQIIRELEPHRRAVYCGSIVRIGFDGRLDSNISIRTLLHHDGGLWVWGGGGIVADSRWEREYQECLDKISFLIHALQA